MLDARRIRIDELSAALADARQRSLDLITDLDDEQWHTPELLIVNHLGWELAHVAWFQENFAVRRGVGDSLLPGSDELFDSSAIHHETRWHLDMPPRDDLLRFVRDACARARRHLDELGHGDSDATREARRLHAFCLFHEDMHGEAFGMTRQTLGYPRPSPADEPHDESGPLDGDVEVPGGTFPLGGDRDRDFVFDNERWSHPVDVEPFRIARAPVTQSQFLEFVEDGGYRRDELWSPSGAAFRRRHDVTAPEYWRKDDERWQRRSFESWIELEPHIPVFNVSFYEAEAFCNWAGRRLPTEAEWEMAAAFDPRTGNKRTYPWGEALPARDHAHFDLTGCRPVDVAAHAAGDSAVGCRQMLGNVWEWTADWFQPFPGFAPDVYTPYSRPSFTFARVLRGGSFASRARLLRCTLRNYFFPMRRDAFIGFRTCAR